MLRGAMQEEGKHTHMFKDIHVIQTHKHHPEVSNGWVVFKEAQKQCLKTERGTASPHLALGWVCVYRREKLINCVSVTMCVCVTVHVNAERRCYYCVWETSKRVRSNTHTVHLDLCLS